MNNDFVFVHQSTARNNEYISSNYVRYIQSNLDVYYVSLLDTMGANTLLIYLMTRRQPNCYPKYEVRISIDMKNI